jgi:hypothetical protein
MIGDDENACGVGDDGDGIRRYADARKFFALTA